MHLQFVRQCFRVLLAAGGISGLPIASAPADDGFSLSNVPFVSPNPTLEEVYGLSRAIGLVPEKTVTPQNRDQVAALLRRIAMRQDEEVARIIEPSIQAESTGYAFRALAAIASHPADAEYFRSFFESFEPTLEIASPKPYEAAVLRGSEVGINDYYRMRNLQNIAGSAMLSYAQAYRRLGMDDAAVPALLRMLDNPHFSVAAGAARALENIESSSAVAAVDRRLREAESKFPLGPWDQQIVADLRKDNLPDERFGRALLYYSILATMKTAEARAAASAALARWEAIYKNHPDRAKYLEHLGVVGRHANLRIFASEITPPKPQPTPFPPEPIPPSPSFHLATPPRVPARIETPAPSENEPWLARQPWLGVVLLGICLLLASILWRNAHRH